MLDPKEKPCKDCRSIFPIEEFVLTNYVRKDGSRTPNAICKKCKTERQRKYQQSNKDLTRIRNRQATLSKYGISVQQYEELKLSQNNLCAICLQRESFEIRGTVCELAVDHDHKTGKVRSLLCQQCNTGLGKFRDDVRLLEAAITYLVSHSG